MSIFDFILILFNGGFIIKLLIFLGDLKTDLVKVKTNQENIKERLVKLEQKIET